MYTFVHIIFNIDTEEELLSMNPE